MIEETGEEETVWTTFGKTDPSELIELDVNSEKVKQLLSQKKVALIGRATFLDGYFR